MIVSHPASRRLRLSPGLWAFLFCAPLLAAPPEPTGSAAALAALQGWLDRAPGERPALTGEPFATAALTRDDATRAADLLWHDHLARLRQTRAEEMKARRLEQDGRVLKFEIVTFGTKPPAGHSLFLSMHGGGNAPPEVNDRQWANQVRLGEKYQVKEGVYVAPRAPTDTWNLWHEGHVDGLFDRLIENLVALEGVNPDRVYLLGYSAGGDGVYQLAPRLADRFAAAAMMAGHPNEASPLGLRNIGFALHMGALDAAYRRNAVAAEWGQQLADLRAADPEGYPHQVKLHEGKGHWMELQDREAIPWMETFTRNPRPTKIVWHQDDIVHDRFYWLAVNPGEARAGDDIVATREGSAITLQTSRDLPVSVLLDDAMLDADQPVTVTRNGKKAFAGVPIRTIATLEQTLATRGQRPTMFSARIDLPAGADTP
jgi:hypothetical protein